MFKTPDELQNMVDQYFEWVKGERAKNDIPGQIISPTWLREPEQPTITGLAYFLGFESRQSFYDYEKEPEFSYTIKRARTRIEILYEQRLFSNANAGAIFGLKNFGWTDKQEIEQHVTGEVKYTGIEVVQPQVPAKPDFETV